uniref:Hexosyltransferase n=1 Tax=Oryza punctata TaxID=4537 RepID=A0A0E0LFK9_ORYPU
MVRPNGPWNKTRTQKQNTVHPWLVGTLPVPTPKAGGGGRGGDPPTSRGGSRSGTPPPSAAAAPSPRRSCVAGRVDLSQIGSGMARARVMPLVALCALAAFAVTGAQVVPLDSSKQVLDWSRQSNIKPQNFSLTEEDRLQLLGRPEEVTHRKLRERTRVKKKIEPVQQDDEALVKLENAGIERSKAVDSAVLGKYSIWRRENENEKADSKVRLMRDQMIMARIYSVLAKSRDKLDLYQDLLARLKESQRSLGEATADAELPKSASERAKAMGQLLAKARDQLYDCKAITQRLRAMLQSADEQVRSLKKQSTFLSQLAAKTIPNGIHCLSMRLTIDYYLLSPEKRKFPKSENLENPDLYHYALFSDNVLAASVVVNSTIMNAKVNAIWNSIWNCNVLAMTCDVYCMSQFGNNCSFFCYAGA